MTGRKKCFLTFVVATACVGLIFYTTINMSRLNPFADEQSLKSFNPLSVAIDSSFFFLETLRLSQFSGRFLCAYESAARHNPNTTVYVIQNSNTLIKETPYHLRQYKNLQFVTLDFDQFVLGTLLELIWPQVKNGSLAKLNISNSLRMLLLYKFGGTYLDSDIISLKALPNFMNVLAAHSQSETGINSAFLKFQHNHPFVSEILQEMASDFNGEIHGYIGPKLVEKIVQRQCPEPRYTNILSNRKCDDMEILKAFMVYPIPYKQRKILMQPEAKSKVKRMMSRSFMIHYWNTGMTVLDQPEASEDQPLYQIFAENCPVTEEKILRKSFIGQKYLKQERAFVDKRS